MRSYELTALRYSPILNQKRQTGNVRSQHNVSYALNLSIKDLGYRILS
jgi:hypothetical protein